ncbi:hypothetical protein GCM10008965_00280 [Methylorubrum aminovorans]|nr:hypothetical protein GCM10025880_00750 [Methylorubrum aminovorans]GMA79844.1 hypothetical protein GCM10025880_62610 [Methylorubrum aminovorans]
MRRRDLTRLPVRHRLSATERASASRNGFLMSRPWMPLYVADYLADTGHLTTAEHGAYLLLIMHYWKNGGLPDDDGKLARIARCSVRDWLAMRQTLSEFFGEGWTHGRIEHELATSLAAYERRARAGAKGGSRGGSGGGSKGSNAEAMLEQCSSETGALQKLSQPQSQDTPSRKKEPPRARDTGTVQDKALGEASRSFAARDSFDHPLRLVHGGGAR